jgi:hypothetical protein
VIRAQQKDSQPEPNRLLPLQDAPVLPPRPAPVPGASGATPKN